MIVEHERRRSDLHELALGHLGRIQYPAKTAPASGKKPDGAGSAYPYAAAPPKGADPNLYPDRRRAEPVEDAQKIRHPHQMRSPLTFKTRKGTPSVRAEGVPCLPEAGAQT
jgi:hypothetical protein